jgi:F0F1-type ATP synthase assembly protein I
MPSSRRSSPSHRRGVLRGIDQSSVMGTELLTATLTWAGIGWLVDRWLGTAPWFLATGALLGNAAGIYLVWLRGKRMDRIEAAVESADTADTARDAPGVRDAGPT